MRDGLMVLLTVMGALLGSHLLIGLCVAHLMTGTRRANKLLTVLVIMMLPFMLSVGMLWNRHSPGMGPALLHAGGALWLAFAVHFLIALAVAFIFGTVAGWMGKTASAATLIKVSGALALALTVFGLVNAKYPRIRNVDIPVRNLPAQWENRAIVQLTDVHLGAIHGKRFLERLVRQVNRLDADVIVITGDLFDIFLTDPEPFVAGLSRFRSRNGVYFVTGNHEEHVGFAKVLQALGRTGMHVLDGRVVAIDGLQFAGAGYPAIIPGKQGSDPFAPGGGYNRELPCVLLFHTPTGIDEHPDVQSRRHLSTYFFPRTDFSYARQAGVDVQLSGHTHAGQTFPFTLLTRLIFGDYAAGLHRMGDFSIYTSPGAGTWGPPVRIGTTPEIAVIRLYPAEPQP